MVCTEPHSVTMGKQLTHHNQRSCIAQIDKGRLRGLQRRLSDVATLYFIDAPYVLPMWLKVDDEDAAHLPHQQQHSGQGTGTMQTGLHDTSMSVAPQQQENENGEQCQHTAKDTPPGASGTVHRLNNSSSCGNGAPRPKRAWLLSPDLLAAQPQLQALFVPHATCSLQQEVQQHVKQAADEHPPWCEEGAGGAALQISLEENQRQQQQQQQIPAQCSAVWSKAPPDVITQEQYTTQDRGWQTSWDVIREALLPVATQDPKQPPLKQQQLLPEQPSHIDGLLGFSQGAAVAAVVAAICEREQQHQRRRTTTHQVLQNPLAARTPDDVSVQFVDHMHVCSDVMGNCGGDSSNSRCHINDAVAASDLSSASHETPSITQLRFVILASGFTSPVHEHQQLLQLSCPISTPSLHIFAGAQHGGSDRQIEQQASEQLCKFFDPSSRRVLKHAGGHLIPCDAEAAGHIKDFLLQFCK